jgi:parvulin-like peptidyl-prolyl isomerase
VVFRADQARDASIVNQYVASLTKPPDDYPSDAEVEAAYQANKQQFMLPRQFNLAQIFIAAPAGAAVAVESAAEQKLKSVQQQLAKRKADFAAIAAKESDDRASAGNGGDTGWVREDRLSAPIREAAEALKDNAISAPVRAPDGWHIIKVLGSKPAGLAPLPDVREGLVRAMRQQRATQNERSYVQGLLRNEPIQLDEIQLQRVLQK